MGVEPGREECPVAIQSQRPNPLGYRAPHSATAPPSASATHVLCHVITKTRAQIKIKSSFCFLILWLFDFSAVLLLLAFASSSCLIYEFISKHARNYARCYELMWCCRLVANLARFLIMTAQQPGLPVSRSFMKMLHIIGSNRLRLQCGMPLFNEDFD